MRAKGKAKWMIVGGALIMFMAQIYDVSVETEDGSRVTNLARMSERQTMLLSGGFLLLAGVILAAASSKSGKPEDESHRVEMDRKTSEESTEDNLQKGVKRPRSVEELKDEMERKALEFEDRERRRIEAAVIGRSMLADEISLWANIAMTPVRKVRSGASKLFKKVR